MDKNNKIILPQEGNPNWNKIYKLNKIVFEGELSLEQPTDCFAMECSCFYCYHAPKQGCKRNTPEQCKNCDKVTCSQSK